MDKVWRFFRTVAWASVGVVAVTSFAIPLLKAFEVGDFAAAKAAAVIGGLTVLGAGIFAVIQAMVQDNPTSVMQRAINQFAQTVLAGLAAPVLADTILSTVVEYGQSLLGTFLAAVVAALTSFAVNQREASADAFTPVPSDTLPGTGRTNA